MQAEQWRRPAKKSGIEADMRGLMKRFLVGCACRDYLPAWFVQSAFEILKLKKA